MKKIVKYIGGTLSYSDSGCTAPTKLIVGQNYEVETIKPLSWQTIITLKGVKGFFNAAWFDDVEGEITPNTYLACSKLKPRVGQRLIVDVMTNGKLNTAQISTIKSVEPISTNIFRVETQNSIYIIQVD